MKGNIVGVGSSKDDALVRYYDNKGKIIWTRIFGKERQESFKSVTLLHDNSFAIAGFSNSFADKGRQMWVIKLYDDGSLVKRQSKHNKGLYEALHNAFKDEPKVHIRKDLTILHDDLVFAQGSAVLNVKHKYLLQKFIPAFLDVLKPFEQDIKNLSINGHTSTEWDAPKTMRYLNNARLSNERAMNILSYSYQLDAVKKHQNWLSKIVTTDGYSYSKLIYANKQEDKTLSRRVAFKITVN